MRRSLRAAAVPAACSALVIAAPTALAGAPIMPLTDVRPGMVCTASSVVSGLEPTTFDATVLGVSGGPRPADALIIMRFSGDAIAGGGIGEGYSGSPVSCPDANGVPSVIGAISQGIGQYDNLVAGVTPIEAMLATPTFGTAPASPPVGQPAKSTAAAKATRAATRAASTRASAPWGTGRAPLTLSGPRGALAAAFQNAAAKSHFPLLISPTATRSRAPAGGTLEAGDAVAASVVTGDVTAGAIGTVTYVDGDRVWAFGHPYNGTGPSRLLMERAQISAIIGSPSIGDQVTYKLGAPVQPVGTVGFDGVSAIGGLLGPLPAMIPTTTTIRDVSGAVVQTATANIVDERPVRGGGTGDLLALGAAANAGTAVQRLTAQSAVGGSARTCVTITLKNGEKPLTECADSVVPLPTADGGVESGVSDAVSAAVSQVSSTERFLSLVDKVSVDIRYRREADDVEIVKVSVPAHPTVGAMTPVEVTVVQGSTGAHRIIPLKVRIPLDAAGEETGIVVLSAAPETDGSSSDSSLVDLFSTGDSSETPAPHSLRALRALFTTDGISGLRAVAIPGMSGSDALDQIQSGPDGGDLTAKEYTALAKRIKLVWELPTYLASGSGTATVTPDF